MPFPRGTDTRIERFPTAESHASFVDALLRRGKVTDYKPSASVPYPPSDLTHKCGDSYEVERLVNEISKAAVEAEALSAEMIGSRDVEKRYRGMAYGVFADRLRTILEPA